MNGLTRVEQRRKPLPGTPRINQGCIPLLAGFGAGRVIGPGPVLFEVVQRLKHVKILLPAGRTRIERFTVLTAQ